MKATILDSASNAQVAAWMKSEISGRHDANWSYRLTFRQMAKYVFSVVAGRADDSGLQSALEFGHFPH